MSLRKYKNTFNELQDEIYGSVLSLDIIKGEIIFSLNNGKRIICIPNIDIPVTYKGLLDLESLQGKTIFSFEYGPHYPVEEGETYQFFQIYYSDEQDFTHSVNFRIYMENKYIGIYDFKLTIDREGDYTPC